MRTRSGPAPSPSSDRALTLQRHARNATPAAIELFKRLDHWDVEPDDARRFLVTVHGGRGRLQHSLRT